MSRAVEFADWLLFTESPPWYWRPIQSGLLFAIGFVVIGGWILLTFAEHLEAVWTGRHERSD